MDKLTPNQRKQYIRQRVSIAALIIIILVMAVSPAVWYFNCKSKARLALAEAKNVELAFRMATTEAYGSGSTIYDNKQESGLKEEYMDSVKKYADVDGDIHITKWNVAQGRVVQFYYKTGQYTVYYHYDITTEKATWDTDYCIHILKY